MQPTRIFASCCDQYLVPANLKVDTNVVCSSQLDHVTRDQENRGRLA